MKRLLAVLAAVMLFGAACEEDGKKPSASERSKKITETYQQRLETSVPYPLEAMRDSIERRNLRERLLRFNKPDKIGYVYLLSEVGTIVAFYTIKGKISSTQSQLTASDVDRCHSWREQGCSVLEAPGDDGSYGPNEDGIFFFTTEGVMVQWSGQFLYADTPLKLESKPVLVYDTTSKPTE